MKDTDVSPIWYAFGAFCMTPIMAILFALMAVLFILGWPFIAILCYLKRREEIKAKHNTP